VKEFISNICFWYASNIGAIVGSVGHKIYFRRGGLVYEVGIKAFFLTEKTWIYMSHYVHLDALLGIIGLDVSIFILSIMGN
jgi:hypothetical protein